MSRCAKCDQEVTSVYVICDRCYKKMDGIREDAIKDILGDDYDLDRLKELVQADREERCVVHPLKSDDEVYIILLSRVFLFEVTSAVWYRESPIYKEYIFVMFSIRTTSAKPYFSPARKPKLR